MNELPKRKNIRLKDYDYSSNGAYFITICVKDKRELLGKIIVGDAHPGVPNAELTAIGEQVKVNIENIAVVYSNIEVPCYVVMPNHIHLILLVTGGRDARCASPTKSVVAKVINALKSLTSRHFGETLWQRGYHDHIIRNEGDYLRIWRYIDENPAKWAEDEYCV